MPIDPASLPRDPDRLIEIIVALQDRNAHLEGVVAALKRTVYGPRSEKLVTDTAQLPLDLDDLILSDSPAVANDDAVGHSAERRAIIQYSASRQNGSVSYGERGATSLQCSFVIIHDYRLDTLFLRILVCCSARWHGSSPQLVWS
jgi:Transposase C of IS166 homeodomain